ncbi:MAG: branched-chain-amino-acid transaminase [Nitrospirota bacterium]
MQIYINGSFYPKDEAKVSVFDHGYLYGDGIYETLRSYDGMVFKLIEHLARLKQSADMMEMTLLMDEDGIRRAIYDTLSRNGLKDAYIRVSVSRGPGEIGLDPALCPTPTFVIIAKPFFDYKSEFYEEGVKIAVVETRRNHPETLNPAIKSTNFLNNIFAKMEAKRAGAFEGIMLNHANFVAEGTISNIFMIKDGVLMTPPLIAGILEGVTRDLVLRLAETLGITVYEELFTEATLGEADEVFITNTTMEIMPVREVGDKVIGPPGRVTKMLAEAYKQEVLRCLKTR